MPEGRRRSLASDEGVITIGSPGDVFQPRVSNAIFFFLPLTALHVRVMRYTIVAPSDIVARPVRVGVGEDSFPRVTADPPV